MAESLSDLFDHGDDFDLCNRLFGDICTAHGNDVDAARLTEEERTVYLVWGAHGVIGNGGFRYLFEHSLVGDPHYALSRHAFEVIGCDEAAEAFSEALSVFSGGRPPTDQKERLRQYLRRVPGTPSPADRKFFAAMGAIPKYLANWVRSRQRAFRHVIRARDQK